MLIVPAIDLKDGRCVRLVEGRLGTERTVAPDAVAQALAFEAAGAQRIHVVDLDGAFEGRPRNAALIAQLCAAVRVPVQVGGGLRDEATVAAVLAAGAAYAIVGTLAVEDPDAFAALAARFPGQLIAGVDKKGEHAATEGWVKASARTVLEVAQAAVAAGAAAVVTTDISRDGTGLGVNVAYTSSLAEALPAPVFASGGVRDMRDLRALAATRVAGVIVGRALYDGTLDLAEALGAG
jgi:phosphoribosylformimino-5-aminoimidazole carboxamide ribotide isomerase